MEGSAVFSRSEAAGTRRERLRSPFVQRYWAFLSYAHNDRATADWLHRALEGFRVPKALVGRRAQRFLIPARLTPVFQDRRELAASTDLSEEIQEALDSSRHLIVLCSPAAARSRWVNEEIRTFKQFRPDGEVLAAIIAGEPWASDIPGRQAEECFPPALRERFDEDGQPTGEQAEPIAADLRSEGDGRERGILKIVAGMLDLRLDDLVQRDEVERHRRWALIAAISVSGMLLTSGLAATAIQSRDAARDQRREAEGLIEFMLGDLRQKLEPIGRLDALDSVATRVLAYYQTQDARELADSGLAQRSRALTLMGEIASTRGDPNRALRLYRAALAGTAEAVRRDPNDPQRLFNHAQNVFYIGDLARQTGRRREAEAAMREYKRLADRMVELEPGNLKWRMERQYARGNLGIILYEERRYPEALAEFERALSGSTKLLQRDPANSEYLRNRLETLAWLADARLAVGKIAEAISARQQQLGFLERMSSGGGPDAVFMQKEVPARRGLGRLLAATGDKAGALRELRRAVSVAQRLTNREPDNMVWQQLAAGAQLELAGILLAEAEVDQASAAAAAGCAKVDRLTAQDSRIADWRALQVDCLSQRTRISLARGQSGEALVSAGQALAEAHELRTPDVVERQLITASVQRLVGDIHEAAGNRAAATASWRSALQSWPAIAEKPHETAVRADLLEKTGRRGEAARLNKRLQEMGYRYIV